MCDESGWSIHLPFVTVTIRAFMWWHFPRPPWKKWYDGYVQDGEDVLWVDDLGITKAQWWWNGFLTTTRSPMASRDVDEYLLERHERILESFRERGLVVPNPASGNPSFRGGSSMWDRIVRVVDADE